ncbi:MAG: hypothetical protein ALECFALPRED_004808 [Alectoria fallacina]|uniref:Uncharacterized protein n=1 Tax=Alectoria fallacina TaxID=1903189 RepID=A0A8H3HVF3_9LECA|nr:MAG: hypothetical protein ALECFALPRED_004808 [Alectoria fallacina]
MAASLSAASSTSNGTNSKERNDPIVIFQTFTDLQKNYERYGGPHLFRHTYKQTFQRFNALNAIFGKIDRKRLMNQMVQSTDVTLFRKLKEIADLRQNYVRTVGSKNFEERTDQSATPLRAEGFFAGLPRLLRNARRETREMKHARKQYPYTSRCSQFLGEETEQAMQNAPYVLKIRFSLSPDAQTKEQLQVLMRWLKLSETDRLRPKPLLTASLREELKYALAETHKIKLYYKKVFQVCKAICIIFACGFFAWRAGSDLIERWRHSKNQAALELNPNEDSPSSSPSKVTADVVSGIDKF